MKGLLVTGTYVTSLLIILVIFTTGFLLQEPLTSDRNSEYLIQISVLCLQCFTITWIIRCVVRVLWSTRHRKRALKLQYPSCGIRLSDKSSQQFFVVHEFRHMWQCVYGYHRYNIIFYVQMLLQLYNCIHDLCTICNKSSLFSVYVVIMMQIHQSGIGCATNKM